MKELMRKFPKLRTLIGNKQSKKFFWRGNPIQFFQLILTPELFPTRKHAKIKKFNLQNAIFHFLPYFSHFFFFLLPRRSLNLGATKMSLSIAHLP